MDWNPKPLDPDDVTVHRRGRGQPLVLLHCLGMDHTRLTYRYQGRDFRLTDVGGNVVQKLLA